MFKKICPICKKKLEGYSDEHSELLLTQHMVVHRDKKEKEVKNEEHS